MAHGACHAAHCIKSIRYSAKSGGYAPLLDDFAKLDRFYAARRRFSKLIHDPAMGIQMQLSTGDMVRAAATAASEPARWLLLSRCTEDVDCRLEP